METVEVMRNFKSGTEARGRSFNGKDELGDEGVIGGT